MKTVVFSLLLLVLALSATAQPRDLGKVMFVGDSITHGFQAASYRWPLHRILVDNGVKYTPVGVVEGNYHPDLGVPSGTLYQGVPFLNRHSAMSNERAYEIAGRINTSGRLENTHLNQWLGLDQNYKGAYCIKPQSESPDVFVLLAGTNDMLGDSLKEGIGKTIAEKSFFLLQGKHADMTVIVRIMRRANPKARILVLSIPSWYDEGRHNNEKAEDFMAIVMYNAALSSWCRRQGVEFVDVNRYLIDPARTDKIGVSSADLFNPHDKVHPSEQGERLIADAVAHALGVPGGTGGLSRGKTDPAILRYDGQPVAQPLLLAPHQAVETPAELPPNGATCAFTLRLGNGAWGGWETEKGLRISLHGGECTVTENAVKWGEQVLCVGDMSHRHRLTLAMTEQGFYLWLDDMLLGEKLQPLGSGEGVRIENEGKVHALLEAFGTAPQPLAPPAEQR